MPDTLEDKRGERAGARPRAAALVGPYGSGKSTLFEALLAAAGALARREAKARAMSTDLRVGHCSFMGEQWALLDCPGSVEFAHETCCGLGAADLAVVVCEPAPEKAMMVGPLLRHLQREAIPHLVFVNKIDTLAGRVRDTIAALQQFSRSPLVLRQVPIREGEP